MIELKNSDLFMNVINKNNVIFGKVNAILCNENLNYGTVFLNEELYPEIKRKIIDKKRNRVSAEIGNALSDGRMVLITLPPDKRLTEAVPFVVFKQNGIRRVFVNLSNIIIPKKSDNDEITYELGDNVNKVYALIHSAYLALDRFEARTTLSPRVLYNSAVLWADMFNKPLYDIVGLNNKDRYYAYMYFSMKFFLIYMMECPEYQATEMALKYVENKNDLILSIEDEISRRELKPYTGILSYLTVMLNDEIVSTKGIRVNTISNSMNLSEYVRKFSSVYSSNAILALCTYPYFMYVITSAYMKCSLVKDKSFNRLFSDHEKILNQLLIDVMKE